MEILSLILPTFAEFLNPLLLVIFFLTLLESTAFVGYFIPGSLILIIFGFIFAATSLNLIPLIVFSLLGTLIGDTISFYIGKKGKRAFFYKSKEVKKAIQDTEKFIAKKGAKAAFIGRFIGHLKPIVAFASGLHYRKLTKFLFWNTFGAVIWTIGFAVLGYFSGFIWQIAETWTTRTTLFIFSVILFFLISFVVRIIAQEEGRELIRFIKLILKALVNSVVKNPEVLKLVREHPVFSGFVSHRFRRNKFSGLPLTLITIAGFYLLFLLFGVVENVVTSSIEVDKRVAELMVVFRSAFFVKVFLWITILAEWRVILSAAAILSLIFYLLKKKIFIIPFWLSLAGAEISNNLGKLFFERARPESAFYVEPTYGFPSAHATISLVFYGFITYVLWKSTRKWGRKINYFFIGFLVIILVGFSRIYLGVHYLSDISGGYFLGALWLLLGISILEWIRFKSKEKGLFYFKYLSKQKLIVPSLIILEVIIYLVIGFTNNPNLTNPRGEIAPQIVSIDYVTNPKFPKFTETLKGEFQEPVSFIILVENDEQLIDLFKKAGWSLADKVSIQTTIKLARHALSNSSYPEGPMTPSFWNAKTHNYGFSRETDRKTIRERHHIRFWDTNLKTEEGKKIFVGTASYDLKIKWLITHKIDPDIDTEREFIFNDLLETGLIEDSQRIKYVKPTLSENYGGDAFFTDGEAYIIEVKTSQIAEGQALRLKELQ